MVNPLRGYTEFINSLRWISLSIKIICNSHLIIQQVELFAVTANETGDESNEMLREMVDIQQEIYSELGFHYRL